VPRILSSFAVLRRSVASRLPASAALDDKSEEGAPVAAAQPLYDTLP